MIIFTGTNKTGGHGPKRIYSCISEEVLAYLHVQISPISCNVVGSILHVLVKNTDTAIVQATGGRGWGDTTPCTVNWCKKLRGA